MSTLVIPQKMFRRSAAAESIAARFNAPLRIPRVEPSAHPVLLRGERNYLRALRAAEMAAWEASLPFELATPFAEAVAETEAA